MNEKGPLDSSANSAPALSAWAPASSPSLSNADTATVEGFGDEWDAYDQTALTGAEWQAVFDRYFDIFPWDALPQGAEGFDAGCGSGRWALGVAPRVGRLHCIDAAARALAVAQRRLVAMPNATCHHASVAAMPMADGSQDFGYSLGVLHHVPDTAGAIRSCVEKLKPGAPFLLYLYYAFDNRPWWFRAIWRLSDGARRVICRLPFGLRRAMCSGLATLVYWPLARGSALVERLGLPVEAIPLSSYRQTSFYTMRTDALDRFGTRLEQRFTRTQIAAMMEDAGLERICFSDAVPYWVALGWRRGR